MALYWITFRIEEVGDDDARRKALDQAVQEAGSRYWADPTSFYLLESDADIDTLARHLKQAVDPSVDIVLVGMPLVKSARVTGDVRDEDLFKMLDFVKRV